MSSSKLKKLVESGANHIKTKFGEHLSTKYIPEICAETTLLYGQALLADSSLGKASKAKPWLAKTMSELTVIRMRNSLVRQCPKVEVDSVIQDTVPPYGYQNFEPVNLSQLRELIESAVRYLGARYGNILTTEDLESIRSLAITRYLTMLQTNEGLGQAPVAKAWLTKVMARLAIDMIRRKNTETRYLERTAVQGIISIDDQIARNESLEGATRRLWEVHMPGIPISKLMVKCIVLKAEGYTLEEIAFITGLTVAKVRTMIQNYKKRIERENEDTVNEDTVKVLKVVSLSIQGHDDQMIASVLGVQFRIVQDYQNVFLTRHLKTSRLHQNLNDTLNKEFNELNVQAAEHFATGNNRAKIADLMDVPLGEVERRLAGFVASVNSLPIAGGSR